MNQPTDDGHYRVIVHPRAEDDIDAVYAYIIREHQDVGGGEAWLRGLRRAVGKLDLMPARHPTVTVRGRPPVHRFVYHSHLVYYEVDEPSRTVQVLRVWHGARNTRPDLP